MQEYFKVVLDFLAYDFSEFAYIIVLGLTFTLLFIALLEVLSLFIFKSVRDLTYYVCYLIVNFVLSSYFTVNDYIKQKIVFNSAYKIYVFLTALLFISMLLYMLVRLVNKNAIKKQKVKPLVATTEEKPKQSNYIKYVLNEKPFEGYLNVNYVKQLINELKLSELTENEYKQLEEFELFLLNFVSRQPLKGERKELSEYMSMLIKKLAKYKG